MEYPRWIAQALRAVARQALEHAAEHGLPDDHHFYISFRTGAPGVDVPDFIHRQHPDEMTIILQRQFWDLAVDEERFSVTLAFGGSRHRMAVPWTAVTAFADPAAELGLRFEPAAGAGAAEGAPAVAAGSAEPAAGEGDAAEGPPAEGAEVVRLDSFRRRHEDAG